MGRTGNIDSGGGEEKVNSGEMEMSKVENV